jgi:hypothetical protein
MVPTAVRHDEAARWLLRGDGVRALEAPGALSEIGWSVTEPSSQSSAGHGRGGGTHPSIRSIVERVVTKGRARSLPRLARRFSRWPSRRSA